MRVTFLIEVQMCMGGFPMQPHTQRPPPPRTPKSQPAITFSRHGEHDVSMVTIQEAHKRLQFRGTKSEKYLLQTQGKRSRLRLEASAFNGEDGLKFCSAWLPCVGINLNPLSLNWKSMSDQANLLKLGLLGNVFI